MLRKAGKQEDLVKSYRFLSLTVADNLSNQAEFNKKFNKQQNKFRKKQEHKRQFI